MKGKITWLTISSLMVLSLVIAACAPAVVEKPEIIEKPKPEVTEKPEVVEPAVEVPKYGGALRVVTTRSIEHFEPGGSTSRSQTLQITNESLAGYDWSKGPAGGYGTGETTMTMRMYLEWLDVGNLVERWEYPTKVEGDTGTVIYYIRKGVHWALNPNSEASRLVGGRELTADDVAKEIIRQTQDPTTETYMKSPFLAKTKITSAPGIVKAEIPWEHFSDSITRLRARIWIVPPELFEKYGGMRDWRNSVGTGPFMLTDHIPGATATFVRNPNYWMKDPVGPGKGNQLPYMDGVKLFLIEDRSTAEAAFRVGKIDQLDGFTREGRELMLKTAPQLKWVSSIGSPTAWHMKLDRPPFSDIRVRRALMMAIDFEAILKDLYGGEGQILGYPIVLVPEFKDAYIGLDDPKMPASVKELYSYNPAKAKQLLAEAGYPQGFKTQITRETGEIDYEAVIKGMWSKVGVDLEIKLVERTAYTRLRRLAEFEGLFGTGSPTMGQTYELPNVQGESAFNPARINDPAINETYAKIQAALIPGIGAGVAEANRLYREMMLYVLEQVYGIPQVIDKTTAMWWPWLKNYSGESDSAYVRGHVWNWVWYDQELKKMMGY